MSSRDSTARNNVGQNRDEGPSKRRRGLGDVTANACTECRKKRAKCDGQIPCGRCGLQTEVECVYEVPTRQSKDDMRSEIEDLQAEKRQNDRLKAALISTDQLEHIISQLRIGSPIDGILDQLETGPESSSSPRSNHHALSFAREIGQQAIRHALQPMKTAMDIGSDLPSGSGSREMEALKEQSPGWRSENVPVGLYGPPLGGTQHRTVEGYPPLESPTQRGRSHGGNRVLGTPDRLLGVHGEVVKTKPPKWTRVTEDTAFVDHLVALYFCWEYPTLASLSKQHFMADYKTGSQQHCSPLLVNAISAVGSRFSDLPQARADPVNSNTAGDHFFIEACKLLEEAPDRHVLTVVQALGLMSIREGSCGRSSHSLFFAGQSIRLAIEMGLHLEPGKYSANFTQGEKIEVSVRSATFWGAFSLDQAWSLSLGRLPQFSQDLRLVNKPALIDHIDAQWVLYTDDGAMSKISYTQPSNTRTVYATFCKLSEIVHKTLYTLYTPGVSLTSKTLNAQYKEYLDFHANLPLVLKLGENFTPAVIFTKMYFYYAMLLLFRPFIKLKMLGLSQVSPRDICAQAAEAISELVKSFSRLYTLRRAPSFVPYIVLTSTLTHVLNHGTSHNSDKSEELAQQGFDSLKEIAKAHGFAYEAIRILEYLIPRWNIPFTVNSKSGQSEDYKLLYHGQATSMDQFCPYIDSVDIVNNIGKVASDENPLFWPFPLQGRPSLDVGPALESLGFSILPEYREVEEKDRVLLT